MNFMRNVKYTDSAQFRCLEHLRGTYMDLYLIHCGLEHCLPSQRNHLFFNGKPDVFDSPR